MDPEVLCVVCSRSDAVRMAPVIGRLRRARSGFRVRVLAAGHRPNTLGGALAEFDITPDHTLDAMRPDPGSTDPTARASEAIGRFLSGRRPDLVLGRGDDAATFAAALACRVRRIPFGHVEAGLHTGRASDPSPEEEHWRPIGRLAAIHFAPTPGARANLLREGIGPASIHVTGDPLLDALGQLAGKVPWLPVEPATSRFILADARRPESFVAPPDSIAAALVDIVYRHHDLSVVFPLPPDPLARGPAAALLGGRDRIRPFEPVGHAAFVALMQAAELIVTDSGGVQEEAAALGKPVLVLRPATGRPQAVAAGAARPVGARRDGIVAAVEECLANPGRPASPAKAAGTHGDGRAAERIARTLAARFGIDPGPPPPDFSPGWPPGDGRGPLLEGRSRSPIRRWSPDRSGDPFGADRSRGQEGDDRTSVSGPG